MTTIGMRTTLTLDELDIILACVRFMRINYDVANPETFDSIVDRLEVMIEYAGTMYHPADLTIEVRP